MTEKRKFNLKDYQKIDGDHLIEKRLNEDNKDEKEPEVINEEQLEGYRADEPDQTIEGQLEAVRTGGADASVERRLDTKDADFEITYRNAEAYEGDINKLEEKRLASDPVEETKYEDASIVPKKQRWWVDTDSPDGLKLAQTDHKKKV